MMKPYLVNKYKSMFGAGISSHVLRTARWATHGSCWISTNVFVWAKEDVSSIMVTLKPDDNFDEDNNYSIDIKQDCVRIRKAYSTDYCEVPHISTEEEYFQQGTLYDLVFPLEIYIMCTQLFDAVAERFCGVYK